MENYSFSFLLTIMAGFSTLVGTFIIFIKKLDHNKIVISSLAFAAGVMICLSITELIPEYIFLLRDNLSFLKTILLSFLGVFLGIIISMLVDYYLPTKSQINIKNGSLFKVGIISMIAIIMHNVPEDCSCYVSH